MYVRDYSWAAGGFYPTNPKKAEDMISMCMEGPVKRLEGVKRLMGAVTPHAGWVYSGPTAGKVFKALKEYSNPSLVICFGAVHVHGVRRATILPEGEWRTPLGNIPIDEKTARAIMDLLGDEVAVSSNPHEEEHSLEVIMPFLKKVFPDAGIVPIMVPPDRNAAVLGRKIGGIISKSSDAMVIGSSDMTHYGVRFGFTPAGVGPAAVKWVKEVNDRKLIELMAGMRADDTVNEATRSQSACGAGAIAATIAATGEMGAKKGYLIEQTTSYDVSPRDGADTFVGYAGVVFG